VDMVMVCKVRSLSAGMKGYASVPLRCKTSKPVGTTMLLKLKLVCQVDHECEKLINKIHCVEGVAISFQTSQGPLISAPPTFTHSVIDSSFIVSEI